MAGRVANPIMHLQRAMRDQDPSRTFPGNAEPVAVDSDPSEPARFVHDFSRIPLLSKTPVRIQAKLTVNTPGDIYEQEADRVAEQVVRMPEPKGKHPANHHMQTNILQPNDTGKSEAPAIVNEVLNSPGQPLDSSARAFMEPRFGYDFSCVRVHADTNAAESARLINALAYTSGRHVAFGAGRYEPHTHLGQRLLAHELAHVQQQGSSSADTIQRFNGNGQEETDDNKSNKKRDKTMTKNVPLRAVGTFQTSPIPMNSVPANQVAKSGGSPPVYFGGNLREVAVYGERPPAPQASGERDVFIVIWDAPGFPSPGHVMMLERDMRVFTSQFPNPHGIRGANVTKTALQTLVDEGRPPTAIFKVHVSDAHSFDLAAQKERKKTKWRVLPSEENQTNCTVAAENSLYAGGVNLPVSKDNSWIGQVLEGIGETFGGYPLAYIATTPNELLNSLLKASAGENSGVKRLEPPSKKVPRSSAAINGASQININVGVGASGDVVRRIQHALLLDNLASLPRFGADGFFGKETQAAVYHYQRKHKLLVNGIVGKETLSQMDSSLSVSVSPNASTLAAPTFQEKTAVPLVRRSRGESN